MLLLHPELIRDVVKVTIAVVGAHEASIDGDHAVAPMHLQLP
jgi:hypothetical protein